MVDWEMRARQLAENLRTVSVVLGLVVTYGACKAEGWDLVVAWLLLGWFAVTAFVSAGEKMQS